MEQLSHKMSEVTELNDRPRLIAQSHRLTVIWHAADRSCLHSAYVHRCQYLAWHGQIVVRLIVQLPTVYPPPLRHQPQQGGWMGIDACLCVCCTYLLCRRASSSSMLTNLYPAVHFTCWLFKFNTIPFLLPRDAMHKRGLCAVSVRQSVTLVYFVECRNEYTSLQIFSPSGIATPF